MSNMVINTNVLALNSHRAMKSVGQMQSKASQRLSTGLRINSAADDAAGLAISEKMRAQIRGLDQASRNAQDAISLVQTAEGGMQEVDNMLQRIRELVVQASNDTNDFKSGDRQKMQDEVAQLVAEIDSMAERVEFNQKKIINGEYENPAEAYAAASKNYDDALKVRGDGTTAGTLKNKNDANTTYTNTKNIYNDLRQMQTTLNGSGAGSIVAFVDDVVAGTITGTPVDTEITDVDTALADVVTANAAMDLNVTVSNIFKNGEKLLAPRIKTSIGNLTAVTALNGGALGTGTADDDAAAAEVNALLNDLKAATDIEIYEAFKSDSFKGALLSDITSAIATTTGALDATTQAAVQAELDAVLAVVSTTEAMLGVAPQVVDAAYADFAANGTVTNGTNITALTSKAAFDREFKIAMDNNQAAKTDYNAAVLADDRIVEKLDVYKLQMDAATTKTNILGGKVAGLYFQVGANADQGILVSIASIKSDTLGIGKGNGETTIDLNKESGKEITGTLDTLDQALSHVTSERSKLGATQNRLEYTIKSLDISSENLSASESRIRDADMAKEMMNLTKANVLQQAATSMLAQANQAPQNVLQLLR